MQQPFTPPTFGATAFNCPVCNAYAQQHWSLARADWGSGGDCRFSRCTHCGRGAISSSWPSGDRHVAEQAIIFVVNTAGEEQSVGVRTAGTIAEADPPEALGIGSLEAAGQDKDVATGVGELSHECRSREVEGADVAVAKVANRRGAASRCDEA